LEQGRVEVTPEKAAVVPAQVTAANNAVLEASPIDEVNRSIVKHAQGPAADFTNVQQTLAQTREDFIFRYELVSSTRDPNPRYTWIFTRYQFTHLASSSGFGLGEGMP
jgi:hypothetical protein